MMAPKIDITDEEYHVSFGLHSGFPLCCVWEFAEGGKGGPCKLCRDNGIEELPDPHLCDPANLACLPYLDRVEQNSIAILRQWLDDGLIVWDEGERVQCHSFITATRTTLDDTRRDMLKDAGYRMVHLCYFEVEGVQHYKYIFQHPDHGKPDKCKKCKSKYSLSFPTVGTS
jgi:hypothetical protein